MNTKFYQINIKFTDLITYPICLLKSHFTKISLHLGKF